MRVLVRRTLAISGAFFAQDVVHSLWALATLKHHPGGGVLHVFFLASRHALPRFNAQDLGNTLWACASLLPEAGLGDSQPWGF